MLRSAGLFLILVAATSCIDQNDYNLHGVGLSPSVAIPLVSGSLSVQSILNNKDSAFIKIAPDSVVYAEYSTTLVSSDIRNLFHIPDKTANQTFALVPGIIPAHSANIRKDSVLQIVDLNLSPEQLSDIDFKSGTFTSSAQLSPSSLNLSYDVVLSSANFVSKSTHQPLSIVAGSAATAMSDYAVTLTKNKFNLKMVLVLKGPASAVTVGANASVAVTFSMGGMDFNAIMGFLGDQTVVPPSATLELGAFGSSLQKANVSFAQPALTLTVVSGYGVPCALTFTAFDARKTGGSLSGQLNPASPVTLTAPTSLGGSAATPINIVNASQLANFGPTSFYYAISARINKGLTSGNNFLADTSQLKVKLDVRLPLFGHASAISLYDTTALDLSKSSQSQVTKASLKVDIVNQIPLDAKIQIYLTDGQYTITDSLLATTQTLLVKGSTVSSSGNLQTAGVVNESVPLDTAALNKLFTSQHLILKATLNTSNAPTDVKFKSGYTMNIKLGLLADMKVNVTF